MAEGHYEPGAILRAIYVHEEPVGVLLVERELRRGRRDFASVAQTRADHYEVQVDEVAADQAQRLIAQMPITAARGSMP